jgi:N-acetylneuraminic acid mutarotase
MQVSISRPLRENIVPRWIAVALLLVFAGCHAAGTASDLAPAPGAWRSEPSMTYARAAHAVVATSDVIYALAGTGAGGTPVLPVERFDGTRWRSETTLPGAGLNAPAAAVLGGRIYLIGGFNTVTNVPSAQVLVYDPATHGWSEAAPLPTPRGGHAAVVLNGRIHVLGGGNSRSTIADHEEYDPATNAWTSRAPLPRSQGSPAAVVSGGRVWSIGGRSGPSDFGFVDVYDPASDRWTAGPAIEPRGTAGAFVQCGAIYLVGGESQAHATSLAEMLRLDTGASAWQPAPPLPTARNFARAVSFLGRTYVVGGSPTPGRSHASEGSAVVESFGVRCPS